MDMDSTIGFAKQYFLKDALFIAICLKLETRREEDPERSLLDW